MKKGLFKVTFVGLSVLLFGMKSVWAADYQWMWSGAPNTLVSWTNAAYWMTSGSTAALPPGPGDDAYIYNTSFFTPSISGTVTIGNLFALGYTPSGTSGNYASLAINKGTLNTTGPLSVVGGYNGSGGWIYLTGVGARWNNSGDLLVGGANSSSWGEVVIENGAQVFNQNAYIGMTGYGYVYIDGTSQWTNSGTLTLESGYVDVYDHSSLISHGAVMAGSSGGGVYISGSSTWTNTGNLDMAGASGGNTYLYLANSQLLNSGTILLASGASSYAYVSATGGSLITSRGLDIASGNTSLASINLDASQWTNNGTLSVAAGDNTNVNLTLDHGSHFLNGNASYATGVNAEVDIQLQNASSLSNQDTIIASAAGSAAFISIDGSSSFSSKNLDMASGAGAITSVSVTAGSTLSSQNATVANGANSAVDIQLDGANSRWSNSGNVVFAGTGSASLRVGNGAQVNIGGTMQTAVNAGAQANIQVDTGGRLNVGTLALGNGVTQLDLGGNNTIGKITSVNPTDITIGNADGGTTTFNGKNNYVGNTTIAFRAQAILNNKDSQFGSTGDVTNNGTIRFGNGQGIGTLTVNGNYTGNNASIYLSSNLNGVSSSVDRLVITGNATGNTMLYMNDTGKKGGALSLEVVTVGGVGDAGAFELNNGKTLYSGMYMYTMQQVGNSWYLVGTKSMAAGNAILNTVGATSMAWFTQLDNVNKRMGDLRFQAQQTLDGYILNGGKKEDGGVDFWVRSYGRQANVDLGISGVNGFTDYLYGIDIGADRTWQLDDNNSISFGYFVGYAGDQRDFDSNGSDGNTNSYYTGLYSTWLNSAGWFADMVIKGQYFDNHYNVDGTSGFHDQADYSNWGAGASLEFGKTFSFKNGYFIEPSVQAAYMRALNGSYTSDVAYVNVKDSNIGQFWGGARTGWTFKVADGASTLQPYVKGGVIEQISSGGNVQIGGDPADTWRPNTDGLQYILGGGIVCQVTEIDQIHLDYEFAFSDGYNVPWNINFGYRHQF